MPSSNDRHQAEVVLRTFLEGQCSIREIQESLSNYIIIDFELAPAQREIRHNRLEGAIHIPVEVRHLRRLLQEYLAGRISEADLSDWAAFVFMAGVFVPVGGTEEERWQAGDGPVWDILQKLMTPSVFDGLDSAVAQRYLDMLE
jgi:hypothetical protein